MKTHQVLLPFFITLCLINLSININVATCHCLGQQQFLLLHLKDNLIFNPAISKKLVHWNQSGDCCQWNGVICNKGRVISLDLSEEYISGGLNSSSLFNLQYLQNLNLAYNDFGSFIPSKFQKLKNLRRLNLSNAGFEGQIPIEISQLTKLATLDLSSSFSSQHILILEKPNIAMFLQNLTRITNLYLDGVRVSADGKQWCHALSSLQTLQVLSMSSCNLSGPIDSSLSKLQSLSVIRLNLNNLTSPVPESFANFSNLTTFQLSNCKLSGVFPKGIFQIQTLKFLDISVNQDLHGTLPNFPQGIHLHTLNLSNTNFSGQLPGAISNLKQLSTIDLSNCQFNGTLSLSLSRLTQLVHLDLSFNNFSGPLTSFHMFKNLRYLSLLHNNLNGAISSAHLDGLANLLTLNLGDNYFSGKVPSSLFKLASLQELTLSHNGFEGPLEEFPNACSSELQLVDLSINKLQGPIPMSIFQLKRLRFLQLSTNEFNGTIRLDMVMRLQHLHTLGLSNNKLAVDITSNDDHGFPSFHNMHFLLLGSCQLGEFPGFLRNLPQLNALDLSNNQIHGIIPNWIWRFDSLFYLNLSNNFLTNLEGPFENLSSNIYILDLHSNQLLGLIPNFTKYVVHLDYSSNGLSFVPPDIDKYLPSANFISLSNNSLQGRIHESFCNISSLRLLDLSHNSFIGFIPKCLATSTLRQLNLAGNKLKGYISDTISTSCNLRYLDLNGNLLGGVIPQSLANCKSLQILNLGNNLFSDRFPCFLRNISTLRVMILRSNKLHGPIGCKHITGNWEMLHIVDLACNNFTGTLSGSLLQSWTKMIGGEDEAHEKYGTLFFDMYDNHDTMRYTDFMKSNVIDMFLVNKLYKLLGAERFSVVDHVFTYYVTSNQFGAHYLDSVTVFYKGSQKKLIKIPTTFTSLDFSSNHFDGPIPQELMSLRALIFLNLSHNSFSSHIPSSLGNLTQLESLDLSYNSLSGDIPSEITSLSFLSVLNLSFNHLEGRIPLGTQIQSFDSYSFEGNEGLCGVPLPKKCSNDGEQGMLPPPPRASETHSSIDWNFLSVELGFTFGLGLVILPIIFWKRWRLWYCKFVDNLLYKVIPQLDFVYEQHGVHKYRTLRWKPS